MFDASVTQFWKFLYVMFICSFFFDFFDYFYFDFLCLCFSRCNAGTGVEVGNIDFMLPFMLIPVGQISLTQCTFLFTARQIFMNVCRKIMKNADFNF